LASAQGLTEQASTFARRDVVDAICKRLPVAPSAEALTAQVEQLTDRFLAERAIPVTHDRRLDERRWSTPELLEVERRLLADALGRQDDGCGLVHEETLQRVLGSRQRQSIGTDQAAMVRDVTCSGAGVSVVVGRSSLEPVGTLSSRDRYALASPNPAATQDLDQFIQACGYRMLTSREVGAAMAFPDSYEVAGTKDEQVAQYGNAVTPPVMTWIFRQVADSLSRPK
jgi:site-specific DNA-cytosine methylase